MAFIPAATLSPIKSFGNSLRATSFCPVVKINAARVRPVPRIRPTNKLYSLSLAYEGPRHSKETQQRQEGYIFTQQSFKDFIESPNLNKDQAWKLNSMKEFDDRMTDKEFPCPFSKMTYKNKEQKFIFSDSFSDQSLDKVKDTLSKYVKDLKNSTNKFNPLLVVFKPEKDLNLDQYHDLGWKFLQYLHDHDDTAWPKGTPVNPDNHLWSFCFEGTQLFINISNPAQVERKARNLGSSVIFVINPRESFDDVAGNTKSGLEVRTSIRNQLAAYEGVNAPHSVGTYGDIDNLEWKQYAAYESTNPAPEKCPLSIIKPLESNQTSKCPFSALKSFFMR